MIRRVCLWMAILSLLGCLAAPLLYFLGRMEMSTYKTLLAVATVSWFVFATTWAARPENKRPPD